MTPEPAGRTARAVLTALVLAALVVAPARTAAAEPLPPNASEALRRYTSLTQASYRAAGVSIPRVTYTQATTGRAVSRGEVQPGDLIVCYSGQSRVAMAVDNVRAVHASTEGVPVKIANIDDIGPISVIRRIVG